MQVFQIVVLLFGLMSCTSISNKNINNYTDILDVKKDKVTFVLYNLKTKQTKTYNKARADSLYLPASTFKILNSLIALENKAIADEFDTIKWDGRKREYSQWNKDHTLQTAFQTSCVWYYQELARRVGGKNMKIGIQKANYGNKVVGQELDQFWLDGSLKVSANQQVEFIRSLINNDLDFTAKYQETVKRIMLTDSTANYRLHSKTGWGNSVTPQIGWFVGYVEKEGATWIFALNLDITNKSDLALRKKLVYQVLQREGII